MPEFVNVLSDIDTLEVTLCRRGKNKKRFALSKEDTMPNLKDMEDVLKAVLDNPADNEDQFAEIFKGMDDKAQAAVMASVRMMAAHKDDLGEDFMAKLAKAAGFEMPDVPANPKKKKDEPAAAPAKKEEIDLTNVPDELKGQLKELWKSNEEKDKAQAAEIKKANEALEVIQKKLDDEVSERTKRDYIAKAQTNAPYAPATPDKIAEMCLKFDQYGDEEAKKDYLDSMAKASKQVEESGLFNELGHGGRGAPTGGANKLDILTKEAMKKSSDPIDYATAQTQVMETPEGRAAYNEYLKDNPKQSG